MSQSSRSAATNRGPLFILVAALLWSTGGLFIKSVTLDAWGVSLWRSGFAAITLFVIYRVKRSKIEHGSRESWLDPMTLLIAFFYSLLLVLFVMATKLTTSANAIFLQFTAPIYVLFIEPLLSKQKLKGRDFLSVVICAFAMSLFFFGKLDTRSLWGNVAALASGVAFATFALLVKHQNKSEAMRWKAVIIGHLFIAGLSMVVILTSASRGIPNATEFIMLAFLGIVQIGIAYALFTFGLSHVRALDATLLSMVEPVLNPVWVYLGIGERPSQYALVGGAIILAVVAYRAFSDRRSVPGDIVEAK